jgi:hypothetical protein
LPARKHATGRPLPAGERDEVWTPLAPLTKEQAAKLPAPGDTEISEVRMSARELLLAINEEQTAAELIASKAMERAFTITALSTLIITPYHSTIRSKLDLPAKKNGARRALCGLIVQALQ